MVKMIVQKDDPVLRQIAAEVPTEEITSPKIQKIIREMKDALRSQEDGAAIAAPQIGYALRIFVVAEDLFGDKDTVRYPSKDKHFVYINPDLIRQSRQTALMDEGCLSVRGYYGNVKRHVRATVKAQDEHGNWFTRGAGGLLAQVFQHEIDHLNGTLFIDRAEEVWHVAHAPGTQNASEVK